MSIDFKQSVMNASERPELLAAVEALYQRVQREIDLRRPICIVSGRCCRFEEYGHRLFVTTLEMATFMGQIENRKSEIANLKSEISNLKSGIENPKSQIANSPNNCPFQKNKLCSVHAIRPFGCRMFFCDATSTEWQNEQYERFHAELKELHQAHEIPYFYMEWRQAIRECLSQDEHIL